MLGIKAKTKPNGIIKIDIPSGENYPIFLMDNDGDWFYVKNGSKGELIGQLAMPESNQQKTTLRKDENGILVGLGR